MATILLRRRPDHRSAGNASAVDSGSSFQFLSNATLRLPAFYKAFGLTIVESMTCGLPTFATCHGGPAEIIKHGISGFHIDPYRPDQASELLVDFFKLCKDDQSHWKKISYCGLELTMNLEANRMIRNALLMQQQRLSARAKEAVNHDPRLHGTGYTDPSKKIQISPRKLGL
ncbi:hypothetical protein K1719_001170 [Acacia pycnantha]|nr:hypothetical protein K1719_001170 [Acacia pycnantha]